MSCYFRHIRDILSDAGIEVTPGNKKEIDRAVHRVMGVNYKDCPATWKRLKQDVLADAQKKQDFVRKLREAIR